MNVGENINDAGRGLILDFGPTESGHDAITSRSQPSVREMFRCWYAVASHARYRLSETL